MKYYIFYVGWGLLNYAKEITYSALGADIEKSTGPKVNKVNKVHYFP